MLLQKNVQDSWKNSYELKKISGIISNKKSFLIIYSIFFQFSNNFCVLLLCRINDLDILNMIIHFFISLLYREVLKFWSNQTFGYKRTCHTSSRGVSVFRAKKYVVFEIKNEYIQIIFFFYSKKELKEKR